jgi:hypothetical protein
MELTNPVRKKGEKGAKQFLLETIRNSGTETCRKIGGFKSSVVTVVQRAADNRCYIQAQCICQVITKPDAGQIIHRQADILLGCPLVVIHFRCFEMQISELYIFDLETVAQ